MKILWGQLTETRYDFPSNRQVNGDEGSMVLTSETTYTENHVAYMSDELGVHKVWNKGSAFAVSLHLYTPPNIVKDGCYVFDALTGKRTHIKSCEYYSVHGNLVNRVAGEISTCPE